MHRTDRITHTTAFVTPVVEHWLEREIDAVDVGGTCHRWSDKDRAGGQQNKINI